MKDGDGSWLWKEVIFASFAFWSAGNKQPNHDEESQECMQNPLMSSKFYGRMYWLDWNVAENFVPF